MVVEPTRKASATSLAGIGMIFVGLLAIVLAGLGVPLAGATQPDPEHKITLCHRTDSRTNPYVTESVDVASALFEGHDGHDGPVFSPDLPEHEKWGDIIPAFDFGPGEQYAGKNLSTAGQAILDAGCVVAGTTTTTTSTSTTDSTSTTTSTVPDESTTTSTSPPNGTTTSSSAPRPAGTTTSTSTGPGVNPQGGPGTPIIDQGPVNGVVPGVTGAAVPGSGSLPFTGSPVSILLGIGGALIASGIGLVVRRRNWAR
jgi:hypothetical protein